MNIFLLILIFGLLIATYLLFFRGTLPQISKFEVDFDRVRELASADIDKLPMSINFIEIATGELPSWVVIAGEFGKPYKITFPSFQIVYKDKTAVVEVPYNKRIFDKFSFGKDYYQQNYNIMQKALDNADFIVATHEHWDHIGGIAQSDNMENILTKSYLTKKQITGPTINDSEFPDNAFENYKPLEYDKYHSIAPGVVLIDAPGHSMGHQLIFVKLQNNNEILFIGDIVWVADSVMKRKSRPWVASKKRFENRRQILHQIKWLYDEFYSGKIQNIIPLTTHDPEQHKEYVDKGIINDGFKIE
ncbi:MAG: MBL fold metallo-hydrolase [Desulfobacula sp.]|nr:MBL fold metallo-hydrolase [Desulfobacula sp.]